MQKIKTKSIALIVFVSLLSFYACDQYKDVPFLEENTTPVILGIANATANEAADTLEIGQLIKVGGRFFDQIDIVKINDVEVSMGKITRLRDAIYFQMPRVPRSDNNILILEGKYGVITYPVNIKYPAFKITGLLNEYTPKGQVLTITGESMDLYASVGISKVTFSNDESGASVESSVVSVSETEIAVVVPQNVPDKATITFYSQESGKKVCPVKYRDSEFIIENLEDGGLATRYPEWVVPNATYPYPLNPLPTEGEKYSHINKISTTAGSTLNFIGNYNVVIPDIYYTNAEEFDLKFEMFVIEPIKYRLAVSVNWGTTWVPLGPSTQSTDSTLWLTTNNQWKTFSIPMSTWKNKTGEKKLRVWVTLPANLLYDVCFDNFRIQRKPNEL